MKTMVNYTLFLALLFLFSCYDNNYPLFEHNPNASSRSEMEDQNDTINNNDTLNNDTIIYPARKGQIRTYFSEDWDYWEFYIGEDTSGWIKTYFSEDWDYWEFNINGITGTIRTYFSEDWDNWEMSCDGYYIRIRTSFSEDWDNWEISDSEHNFYADADTYFSNDFDHWEVNNSDFELDFSTYFSEDWDYWEVYGDTEKIDLPHLIACSFVTIFTSSIYIQDIIHTD